MLPTTTTMRSSGSLLVFAALSLAACDPVLFSAEIDATDLCVSGYLFDFSPAGVEAAAETTMSPGDLTLPDGDEFEFEVAVRAITVWPTAGVGDLAFLETLIIRATPTDEASSLPELMVVDMDQTDLADDGSLHQEPETPVDIGDHLRSGGVLLRTEIAGELPDIAWESSMEVCVRAAARYRQPI